MFSAIRKRMTWANVAMTLALVFTMTGGAYAAKKYLITSTKQISPSVLKALAGKPGQAGAQGPAGPAGPQGPAGSAGVGTKGETGKEGGLGKEGPTGPKGAVGATGATGPKGATGEPWPAGGTLPSGATETGMWSIDVTTTKSVNALTAVSFPIPLAKGGSAYFFTKTQTTKQEFGTSGCKGTVEQPTAPSGVMCVYTKTETIVDPEGSRIGIAAYPGGFENYGPAGTTLNGSTLTVGKGPVVEEFGKELIVPEAHETSWGSWAVTAP